MTNLQPHQKRAEKELKALTVLREGLEEAFSAPFFGPLPQAEKRRMKRQVVHMTLYEQDLTERVEWFYELAEADGD